MSHQPLRVTPANIQRNANGMLSNPMEIYDQNFRIFLVNGKCPLSHPPPITKLKGKPPWGTLSPYPQIVPTIRPRTFANTFPLGPQYFRFLLGNEFEGVCPSKFNILFSNPSQEEFLRCLCHCTGYSFKLTKVFPVRGIQLHTNWPR